MIRRCLYCYSTLYKTELDFHEKCSLKFFGSQIPPEINLDKKGLEKLAKEIVIRSIAITGVQPKLSLTIEKIPGDNKKSRMTIVGVNGNYILKPQSEEHSSLPENEDVTMHLAELIGIKTAEHSLIRIKSGDLAYITKRFDRSDNYRINGKKFHCEDLCQLSEMLTEHKYKSSMEKTGKIIKKYSSYPMLDALAFFEIAIFSFITGNADMHLKNFSLLKDKKDNYLLAPCYDLLSTKLAVPEDNEELALTINGRKNKIGRKDFDALGLNLELNEKQLSSVYKNFKEKFKELIELIKISFLSEDFKIEYCKLVKDRLMKLKL